MRARALFTDRFVGVVRLGHPLTEGEMRKVTLIFEHAGRVEVEFMIDPPMGEDMGDMDHSTMDMGEGSGG